MDALILAGGFGTRLRPLTYSRPKCLLPVNNIPILEYQRRMLTMCDTIVFATNYLEDNIRAYLERHSIENVVINHEDEPLGTGGAIRNAMHVLGDEFFVLNGDIISDCPLESLPPATSRSRPFAMVATYKDDVSRYGLLDIDGGKVAGFHEKMDTHQGGGWINAGMYYFTADVFDAIPKEGKSSIERDTFPVLASDGNLGVLRHRGMWHDIGTKEDYIRANVSVAKSSYVAAPDCIIKGSVITNSVLLPGSSAVNSTVTNSVLGYDAAVTDKVISDTIVA